MKASATTSKILGWYESVSTRVIDLVGDYAGNELFLLEGDSLLLECFGDEKIDFGGESLLSGGLPGESSLNHGIYSAYYALDGFQLLHAVYVVERFLENLVKRKCNFHIVFFESELLTCILVQEFSTDMDYRSSGNMCPFQFPIEFSI